MGECPRLGKGKSALVKNFCTNRSEARLFLAHRATPAPNDDSEEWSTGAFRYLSAHIPVELHRDHGISKGKAFFDTEPQFPCSALFLDHHCALLLKSGASQKEFRRIGIGYFWRTENTDFLVPVRASTAMLWLNLCSVRCVLLSLLVEVAWLLKSPNRCRCK